MAVLNITVDDTHIDRAKAAYGVATNAQLKTAVIADIKAKIVSYEVSAAHTQAESSVTTAQQAVIQAGVTAKANAEAISIT